MLQRFSSLPKKVVSNAVNVTNFKRLPSLKIFRDKCNSGNVTEIVKRQSAFDMLIIQYYH